MRTKLPNVITSLRLVVAGVVLVLIAASRLSTATVVYLDTVLALFIVAMASDWLDGYLARRFKAVSKLGRMLDPFVDKVLVCGLFILLSGEDWGGNVPMFTGQANGSGIAPWVAAVIVIRELMVSMLRGFGESSGRDYSARYIGKVKLCVQTGFLIAVLLILSHLRDYSWVAYVRDLGTIGVVVTTVISAVVYIKMGYEDIRGDSGSPRGTCGSEDAL